MTNRDRLMARFLARSPKPGKRHVKLKRGHKPPEADPRQRVKA